MKVPLPVFWAVSLFSCFLCTAKPFAFLAITFVNFFFCNYFVYWGLSASHCLRSILKCFPLVASKFWVLSYRFSFVLRWFLYRVGARNAVSVFYTVPKVLRTTVFLNGILNLGKHKYNPLQTAKNSKSLKV